MATGNWLDGESERRIERYVIAAASVCHEMVKIIGL
jgi:hypothetical protein